MVRGMRTRHIIARWLGHQNELNRLRDRCALNLALASGEKRRADAATQLLIEARQERGQWERTAAACEQTLADMSADDRRVEALILRARHTMNINPAGARAQLDQAVRILRGEA